MANTTHTVSTADPENFDIAVQWAEARFGHDARINLVAQYRHHADTMIRVEGYDSKGRHFTDERYLAELPRLIAVITA